MHFLACKIVHPMHARAILGRLARKKAVLGEAEGECPAMLSRAAGQSVISAGLDCCYSGDSGSTSVSPAVAGGSHRPVVPVSAGTGFYRRFPPS